MRIYFFEWNKTNPMHAHWILMRPMPEGPSALDKHQIQASALDLSYFTSKSKCKLTSFIHDRKPKSFAHVREKLIDKMALKCHKTCRILTTLPSEKNGSVDVTFACAITHQKHLAQSGRSTRSAVDIFNTLRVLTKEPIREQEIKLECMNCNSFAIAKSAFVRFVKIQLYTSINTSPVPNKRHSDVYLDKTTIRHIFMLITPSSFWWITGYVCIKWGGKHGKGKDSSSGPEFNSGTSSITSPEIQPAPTAHHTKFASILDLICMGWRGLEPGTSPATSPRLEQIHSTWCKFCIKLSFSLRICL